MNVILASASPRRAQLLSQVGIRFEVEPSTIEETFQDHLKPSEVVTQLARDKAEDVALRFPERFIIAADTIVCLEDRILGKPEDERQATEFLTMLSSRTHDVFSGVFAGITDSEGKFENEICFFERTKVTFAALSPVEIQTYINFGHPFDKAGSYGIQDDLGSLFVEKIQGDYYNVVGFPLHRFYSKMKSKMPEIHEKLFFQTL